MYHACISNFFWVLWVFLRSVRTQSWSVLAWNTENTKNIIKPPKFNYTVSCNINSDSILFSDPNPSQRWAAGRTAPSWPSGAAARSRSRRPADGAARSVAALPATPRTARQWAGAGAADTTATASGPTADACAWCPWWRRRTRIRTSSWRWAATSSTAVGTRTRTWTCSRNSFQCPKHRNSESLENIRIKCYNKVWWRQLPPRESPGER